MDEKIGIAELLAAVNIGKEGSGSGLGKGGALWAIFVIILIFAVIWLVSGGALFGGISKNTTVGGLLTGEESAEAEEVRRLRTKDLIDAEFYRKKIISREELDDSIRCVNKTIVDTATIVTERAYNYADRGDCRLDHKESSDVCKLQQEINTLDCRKIDKEFKRVAFCADPMCPDVTSIQSVNGDAVLTTLNLILDKLGK